MIHARLAALAAVFALAAPFAAAAEQIGPFALARKLLNPASPQPGAISANGIREDADLIAGNATAGTIKTVQWQGTNQLGTRSWAGTTLVGAAGKNYKITLVPWEIAEYQQMLSGQWSRFPRWQQDGHVRLAFLAKPRAQLAVMDGTGFGIDGAMVANAVVVELGFRNKQGGGTEWQMSDRDSVPLEVGVWQVAQGQTLEQAQAAANNVNKLSELAVLAETQPDRPISVKFQVGTAGSWAVILDINNDNIVDYTALSSQAGNKPTTYTTVSEASGLLVTCAPAAGVDSGRVGETIVNLGFTESASAPVTQAIDRRPLVVTLPDASRISPLCVSGSKWPSRTVTVTGGSTSIPVNAIGPAMFQAEVPLNKDAPVTVTVSQNGTPATVVSKAVQWHYTDLYNPGETTLRVGDSLLWTYNANCGPAATTVGINADGLGAAEFTGPSGTFFPYKYTAAGTFTAKAIVNNVVVGTHTVRVVSVKLPDRIAAEVGFARQLYVDTGAQPASGLWYGSAVAGEMDVALIQASGNQALISVKPLKRGRPQLVIRSGGATGPIIASKEVHEFELVAGAASLIGFDPATGQGKTKIRMSPYLPNIDLRFSSFGGRAGFKGGAKSFTANTSSSTTSLGEPGFKQGLQDPNGEPGEKRGWLTYTVSMAIDQKTPGNTGAYCYSVKATEQDETGPGGSSTTDVASTDAYNGVPVWAYKSLLFTKEDQRPVPDTAVICPGNGTPPTLPPPGSSSDDQGEDEVYPIVRCNTSSSDPEGFQKYVRINPEYWTERTWELVSSEGGTDASVDYRLVVSDPPTFSGPLDNPTDALFDGGLTESNCKEANSQCETVSPIMHTGTIPGGYTTSLELCTDEDDDDEVNGKLTETTGGAFWISKLDAHGLPNTDACDPNTSTRKKFPDYAEVLPKRKGTVKDPVIIIESGGQDQAHYGVGTASHVLIDPEKYCWKHTVSRRCAPPTNAWVFSVRATDPDTGENLPAGYEVRWREAHFAYDGSTSPILMKTECLGWKNWAKDGYSGSNKERVRVAYNPGRHFPRVEVWKTHAMAFDPATKRRKFSPITPVLSGYAEIHSLAVEAELDSLVPLRNQPDVHANVRIGTPWHLTNNAGGEAIDAKIRIAGPAPKRGRVALDGYPQNEYWYTAADSTDLAQVVMVPDGVAQKYFLQGYDKPTTAKEELKLHVDGQAFLEICDSCWTFKGSPVAPQWQSTDTEVFNSLAFEFITGVEDPETGRVINDRREAVKSLGPAVPYPMVMLNSPSASSGTDMVSVSVTGEILDPAADIFPQAAGLDIPKLDIFANGVSAKEVSLTRDADATESFWRPYPYKHTLNTTVSVEAIHSQYMRLVTRPNLANSEGYEAVSLKFSETATPLINVPGNQTVTVSAQASAQGFAPMTAVTLTINGTAHSLARTSALRFAHPNNGLTFTVLKDVAPRTSAVDTAIAAVGIPGVQGIYGAAVASLTETGNATLIFAAAIPAGAMTEVNHYLTFTQSPNATVIDTIRYRPSTAVAFTHTYQETSTSSKQFNSIEPHQFLPDFQLISAVALTAAVDQIQISYGTDYSLSGAPRNILATLVETSPTSKEFYFKEVRQVAFDPRFAYSSSLVSSERTDRSNPGKAAPLTLRVRGYVDCPASFTAHLNGKDFRLVEVSGAPNEYVMARSGKRTLGLLTKDELGSVSFKYWDHKTQLVVTVGVPAGPKAMQGQLIDPFKTEIARTALNVPVIRWFDYQGNPYRSPHRVDFTALLSLLADEDIGAELPAHARVKVRLYGHSPDSVLRMVSGEFPGEKVELFMTEGKTTATRLAPLVDRGSYADTEQWVVLYESDEDGTQLSDAQWHELFERFNILAIHNPEPTGEELDDALKKEIGRDAFKELTKSTPNTQQHHLFNAFRDPDNQPGRNEKYRKFFKAVFGDDFDVDDYCVEWDSKTHHQKSPTITKAWRDFINANIDADGNLLPGTDRTVLAKQTFQKAMSLADTNGYGTPDHLATMRRHTDARLNGSSKVKGSGLDKLLKLAQKGGWVDFELDKRWAQAAGKIAKSIPGGKALRFIPYVGTALRVFAIVTAASDPRGALAQELDVSRETIDAWFDGDATLKLNIPWPGGGQERQSVEFADKSFAIVGMAVWHWAYPELKDAQGRPVLDANGKRQADRSRVLFKKHTKITKIVTESTAGSYTLFVQDLLPDGQPAAKDLEIPGVRSLRAVPPPDSAVRGPIIQGR